MSRDQAATSKPRMTTRAVRLLVPILLAGAALVDAGPAGASTTLGAIASDTNVSACSQCSEFQVGSSATRPTYTVPHGGGVITSWTFHARGGGGTARLRLFTLLASIYPNPVEVRLVEESADQSFALGETKTTLTRIPVQGGEHLGIATDGPSGFTFSADPADGAADFPYGAPVGTFQQLFGGFTGYRVAVSATLEPDADQDGYGDDTQDGCPSDPAIHTACPSAAPPPGATGSAPVDTTPPSVTVGAPARESLHKGRVYLFATSNEAGKGVAGGKVQIGSLARRFALRSTNQSLTANSRTKLVLSVPKKTLRAVRGALARGARPKANLTITVTDGAGNTTVKSLTTRLKK